MIGLKNSYEIAYNGTENECRFELYADTSADLQGLTHIDGIKIQMGSECTDIATGDKYILNGSGAWILQPSDCAFSNVYTKAEIDSMITEIYGIIAYYHTTLVSDTGEITFYSIGGNVGTWTIYGNVQQTGTPTPDAPIMPEFVGVRTGNLFDYKTVYASYIDSNGDIYATANQINAWNYFTADDVGKTLTIRAYIKSIDASYIRVQGQIDGAYTTGNAVNAGDPGFTEITVTVTSTSDRWRFTYGTGRPQILINQVMLNHGSTALPYEPYGYKIPITCAGQTNNVYMSAPLRKAIDGSDAVDTIDSSGTLTRNVDENGDALVTPTTETVSVPNIPTFSGENTLTVDTELKPSRIEIQGGYHA